MPSTETKLSKRLKPFGQISSTQGGSVSLRCPACKQVGMFYALAHASDVFWMQPSELQPGRIMVPSLRAVGVRRCPNDECGCVAFVMLLNGKVEQAFPAEAVDLDLSNLPPRIATSLQEAADCSAASCFRAAAIMIRRVLEELCEDKGAKGDNLKQSIAGLGQLAILPVALLEAADDLRLLGNDGAHLSAKVYDQVGAEEVAVALRLTKELLKAVYQYSDLVDELRKFKKQPG